MNRLNYQDNYFSAIFSFAAINLTPWKETLKEFHRTLNSKGILYFNAYDLGWMIYNIIEQHHPAEDFDPRDWAIRGIKNTTEYLTNGKFSPQSPKDTLYIPKTKIQNYLNELGFNIISITGDGLTKLNKDDKAEPFWPSKKYGYDAVYEILCIKK